MQDLLFKSGAPIHKFSMAKFKYKNALSFSKLKKDITYVINGNGGFYTRINTLTTHLYNDDQRKLEGDILYEALDDIAKCNKINLSSKSVNTYLEGDR